MGVEGLPPVERGANLTEPGPTEAAAQAALVSFASLFAALANGTVPVAAVKASAALAPTAPTAAPAGPPVRLEGVVGSEPAPPVPDVAPVAAEPGLAGAVSRPATGRPANSPAGPATAPPAPGLQPSPEPERSTVPAVASRTHPAAGEPRAWGMPLSPDPTSQPAHGTPRAAPPGLAGTPAQPVAASAAIPPAPGEDAASEPLAAGTDRVPVRRLQTPVGTDAPPDRPDADLESGGAPGPALPDTPRPPARSSNARPLPVSGGSSATVAVAGETAYPVADRYRARPEPAGSCGPEAAPSLGESARLTIPAASEPDEPRSSPPNPARRAMEPRPEAPAPAAPAPVPTPPASAPPGVDAPTAVPLPATGRLVDTLVRQARLLARDGRTRLEVELEPPALGRVVVEAVADGTGVQLVLIPTRAEAVLVLAGALPSLERALAVAVGGPVRTRLELRDRPPPDAPPPRTSRAPRAAAGVVNVTV